eukprot:Hpha_TRINITY_DN15984_c2_g3::TRINITY_DN15984_c2_g3_i1::g.72850::m.72850
MGGEGLRKMSAIQHQRDLGERTASGRNEPTSEVQSLRPHMANLQREMGQKFVRVAPPSRATGGAQQRKRRAGEESAAKRLRTGEAIHTEREAGVRGYQPKTRETREAHRELLAACQQALGDADHVTLLGCCEELLNCLKDTSVLDRDKKGLVEAILGTRVTDDNFRALLVLSRRITDFAHAADGKQGDEDLMADDQGVAVVFEDSDEDRGDDLEMEIRPTRERV